MTEFVSTTVASNPPAGEPWNPVDHSLALLAEHLLPTVDQQELAGLVRSFLAARSPESLVREAMESDDGLDLRTWQGLVGDLGVGSLLVSTENGGGGASLSEVLIVTEELGRSLSCVPWFSSVVLAQTLLVGLGESFEKDEVLGQLTSGQARAAVAFNERGSRWDSAGTSTVATKSPDGWRLRGQKIYVVDGHTAETLLVPVSMPDASTAVFAVDGQAPELRRSAVPTMDLTRKQATLEFHDVPARLIAHDGGSAFRSMLDAAAAALAAECVGGAQFVMETAVDYAKTRVQFGRPIGSFQAIKHKCADMLMALETARSSLCYARAASMTGDAALMALASSVAKATCGDAYMHCAGENIQIHGGIGFTWEHSAHLYYKRARANSLMFGSSREHRVRVADLIDL